MKTKNLTLIDGKAVLLSPKAEKALAQEAGVLRIDDDVEVFALTRPDYIKIEGIKPQPVETLPWGVDRIDADLAWGITTGDPIKVAIVDTGIDIKPQQPRVAF